MNVTVSTLYGKKGGSGHSVAVNMWSAQSFSKPGCRPGTKNFVREGHSSDSVVESVECLYVMRDLSFRQGDLLSES